MVALADWSPADGQNRIGDGDRREREQRGSSGCQQHGRDAPPHGHSSTIPPNPPSDWITTKIGVRAYARRVIRGAV